MQVFSVSLPKRCELKSSYDAGYLDHAAYSRRVTLSCRRRFIQRVVEVLVWRSIVLLKETTGSAVVSLPIQPP